MPIGKYILHIVYTNSIVAISTGLLCAGYCTLYSIENALYYGVWAGLSTFAVYNGQRLIKSGQLVKTPWLSWVSRNTRLLYASVFMSLLGALSMLICIGKLSTEALLLLIFAIAVSGLYVIRIGGINMREIAHLKIHLVAVSWSAVLLVFPVLNEGLQTANVLIDAVALYVYVVAVTIPFDIRDLKFDEAKQRTLPQVIGINASKGLSVFLLALFTFLMLYTHPELSHNTLFYLAVLIQALLMVLMHENRGDLYCAGIIDGAISLLGWSLIRC